MTALARTAVLPEASPLGALSAQLRRSKPWSAASAIRRLQPSPWRTYRSSPDGVTEEHALSTPPATNQDKAVKPEEHTGACGPKRGPAPPGVEPGRAAAKVQRLNNGSRMMREHHV